MGQALYRKYRSKSLKEIVGQEHITETLDKALQAGRISHAYLFTGPRGVGKTSIARILAHEINGLPYDEEQTHIDIIEIDAASNRRIDEIRELRDKVFIAPAMATYKVYIIDEVHMLTREAFNALLKTLEEPPAHAVFILATTEAHKLPETIISRTQRFVFRPIEPAKAVAHLRHIADAEKIKVTDEALGLIAMHGDGSFRDSISLLDQAGSHGGKVDAEVIRTMLGVPPAEAVQQLLDSLQQGSGDAARLVGDLNALYEQGFGATLIAKQLGQLIRDQLVRGTTAFGAEKAVRILANLLEVAASHDPGRYLEIILLEALPPTMATVQPAVLPKTQPEAPLKVKPAKPAVEPSPEPEVKLPKKVAAKTAARTGKALDEASWAEVLGQLKKQYNTLYGIVRMARPDFSQAGTLGLTFAFAFHQKRMNEAKNQQIVSDIITNIVGQPLIIRCSLDPELKLAKPATAESSLPELPVAAPDDSLATISNIFGGGELLQS